MMMMTRSLYPLMAIFCSVGTAASAAAAAAAAFAWSGPSTAASGRRHLPTTMSPHAKQQGASLTPKAASPAPASASFGAAAAAAFAGAAVLLSPLPSSAASADVAHGAALFKAECAGCHIGGSNVMSEKKTLQKDALEQYQSLDATKLQAFVQDKMPHSFLPFHSKWSDQDFQDAVGYVLDQAVSDKWE
jgi:cytochrome c6